MKEKASKLVYSTDDKLINHLESERKNPGMHLVEETAPESQRLKVWLQTKGRRGKMVTIIQGFELSAKTMNQLARQLKQILWSWWHGQRARDRNPG